MPSYSEVSKANLLSCHTDLVTLFTEVIKIFDNTILYGMRTPLEQFTLYKKGRIFNTARGEWVIVQPKQVVTYKDGYQKKSKHNIAPSIAVDATPYPIDFTNSDRQYYFAGIVKGIAAQLYAAGRMNLRLRWGGDWDNDTRVHDQTFYDLCHFELI